MSRFPKRETGSIGYTWDSNHGWPENPPFPDKISIERYSGKVAGFWHDIGIDRGGFFRVHRAFLFGKGAGLREANNNRENH